MTEDMMSLRTFVEKTPDADLLREMIGFAAERLMELEVGAATGAGYGEKNPLRQTQRNGYRDRGLADPRRDRRAAHPEAQEGLLLPLVPRTPPHGRESADGGDPGGLHQGDYKERLTNGEKLAIVRGWKNSSNPFQTTHHRSSSSVGLNS